METIKRFCTRRHITLTLVMLFASLLLNPLPGGAAEEQVGGRYKFKGRKISHRIIIPEDPPAAVILVQYLPAGTVIEKAVPHYSSYDPVNGVAKWLFTEVQPGPMKVKVKLGQKVPRDQVSAEVLFKDAVGGSETLTISPMPLKRAAIEGC